MHTHIRTRVRKYTHFVPRIHILGVHVLTAVTVRLEPFAEGVVFAPVDIHVLHVHT
jgi:hypothetical protein